MNAEKLTQISRLTGLIQTDIDVHLCLKATEQVSAATDVAARVFARTEQENLRVAQKPGSTMGSRGAIALV